MIGVAKRFLLIGMVGLLGCPGDSEPEPTDLGGLSTRDLLVRASIDLRGVRPSADELAQVKADPDALEPLIDAFLLDEGWSTQAMDLLGYAYLTRIETYYLLADQYGFGGVEDIGLFTASVGQEALQVAKRIAEEDLPWTEIVTADWTMANEYIATMLPVDYPAGETGWQQVQYTDGRPTAGILTTSTMWIRYTSTPSNVNRGRANAVSRMLLCNDYLDREIEFDRDINLLDEALVLDAIQNNPGCNACHSSLDPLASHFFGFMHIADGGAELVTYHAERENWWELITGTSPGYYGQHTADLTDLGWAMAYDTRLASCAVETFYEGLLQRDVQIEDTQRLLKHLSVFENNGLTLRALYRSVINGPEYRGKNVSGTVSAKMVRPEQFASQVEALTGYRMTAYNYDLLQTDLFGIRTLAGGVDGESVTQPPKSPNVTTVLAQERIAEAASWTVVEADARGDEAPLLFDEVDFSENLDTARDAVRSQLESLHVHVLSHDPDEETDSAAIDASESLWGAIYDATNDPKAAWAGVLSALLRDPEFIFY